MRAKKGRDTTAATKERKKIGEALRSVILKILEKQDGGASIYELTTLLKHEVKSPGTVKSALDKLEELGKIEHREFRQDGRKITQYFIKQSIPPGFVSIKKEQLSKKWKNVVYVYAQDNENIVATPIEETSANKEIEKIELNQNPEYIQFNLTSDLIHFYQLNERGISLEPSGDKLIIHVGSKSRTITKSLKKFKILLAEDEPNDERIKSLVKKFKEYSHQIEIASTIDQLNKIVKKKGFDFFILDMTMNTSDPLKLKHSLELFHKVNPKAKSIIITTQVYGKKQISDYSKKGFSWFYDKDTPNLDKKILTRMIEEY